MKPKDFGASMIQQAHQLRDAALNRSGGLELDRKTTMWLIPIEHKRYLYMEMGPHLLPGLKSQAPELLGIPIRFTAYDEPGTPELQLVMEPMLFHRRKP